MTPIRVAQVVGKMVNGGVEAVVMNYYRHIDREKVQFDFIVDEDSTVIPKDEIEKLGGRVFIVPPYQKLNKYIPALIKLFKENKYKIVHSHINTLSVFPLFAAKRAGVPVRIAHNHSTAAKGETKKNILKYVLRPFAKVYATHYAACSKYAAEWLFGKKTVAQGKVTIFNNAIDLDKFKFDENVRNEVRKELGIEDKFVIGHVGRFCYQKNQEFLVDIFEEVYKQNPNAVLMLVGDGPDREKIEEKIKNIGGVILLGNRTNVDRLYQAIDIFVFPSRYEGLGIAAIEAQVCGIKTIISEAVPNDAVISSNTEQLLLEDGAGSWAEKILSVKIYDRAFVYSEIYDISIQADKLTEFYEGLSDEGSGKGQAKEYTGAYTISRQQK